jgi:twitching motility protein PilI
MANKVALRELQTRLAARLDQVENTGVAAGWLAVEVGAHGFLLPLVQSGEIFPWTPIQKVPYTLNWFLGVANLRGGMYGVVDVHQFLFDSAPTSRTEVSLPQSRLIALNAALDVNCVLMVDRLAGLRNAQSFSSQATVAHESRPAFYGVELIDHDGRHWQELDLQKLASDAHFLLVATKSELTH